MLRGSFADVYAFFITVDFVSSRLPVLAANFTHFYVYFVRLLLCFNIQIDIKLTEIDYDDCMCAT